QPPAVELVSCASILATLIPRHITAPRMTLENVDPNVGNDMIGVIFVSFTALVKLQSVTRENFTCKINARRWKIPNIRTPPVSSFALPPPTRHFQSRRLFK
ncbi:MAG TPA: hypothetical protein VMH30_14305, partial [Verrucomicrobiae bacterium]|nr:hypothetical protein [Verrucomicrobiae bacterium]